MKKQLLLLALLTVLFSLLLTLFTERHNGFESFIYGWFMTGGLQCLQLTLAFLPWWMYLYYCRKRKRQPALLSSIFALLVLFDLIVLLAALPNYARAQKHDETAARLTLWTYLRATESPAFLQATIYAFALPLGTFFFNRSYHK